MSRVLTVDVLRALGPERLAEVVRRRPDVLEPVPPRSLHELVARLTHPTSLLAALRGFDTPTLQVAEALAALRDAADRPQLERLLGVGKGDEDSARRVALDRALTVLDEYLFLERGAVRLLPEIARAWPEPLGLGPAAAEIVPEKTAEVIRSALRELGVPTKATLKADLVRALVRALTDADHVRRVVDAAPPHVADRLRRAALGEVILEYYLYVNPRYAGRNRVGPVDPAEWAIARMLAIQTYQGLLLLPAEVALALRGPDWRAPFDAEPPAVRWRRQPRELVDREMVSSAGNAVRVVTALLEDAGTRALPLLKNGAVGVRELRRLGKAASVPVPEVRLGLALAHAAGLLGTTRDGAAPTRAFDAWRAGTPARQLADLVAAWTELSGLPILDGDAPWQPSVRPGAATAKAAVLGVLAGHDLQAPDADDLAAWIAWHHPLPLGGTISNGPEEGRPLALDLDLGVEAEDDLEVEIEEDVDDEEAAAPGDVARRLVPAVLAEAGWLGLVAVGALTPAGRASTDGTVEAVLGDTLGTVRHTARLQGDLTAVVLGHPSAELAATLDRMADRETRSAAATWRFSPQSIRRALDAGASARQLTQALADLAEGGVPQPLEYLVGDVARRHGALRGGSAQCYLRSDDVPLLSEVIADRRVARLGLRLLAPTVAAGQQPLAETLAALRGAGYAPVEEGPDGDVVLARATRHRSTPQPRRTGATAVRGRPPVGQAPPAPDVEAEVARLLRSESGEHGHARRVPSGAGRRGRR